MRPAGGSIGNHFYRFVWNGQGLATYFKYILYREYRRIFRPADQRRIRYAEHSGRGFFPQPVGLAQRRVRGQGLVYVTGAGVVRRQENGLFRLLLNAGIPHGYPTYRDG